MTSLRLWGLSPRLRGNRFASTKLVKVRLRGGLSPRLRGNPSASAAPHVASPRGLSPRLRGNRNHPATPLIIAVAGLSPRLRGNPKRHIRNHGSAWGKVYPRAYGGTTHGQGLARRGAQSGLSPRLRGNPVYQSRIAADRSEVYPRAYGGTEPTPSPLPGLVLGSIPAPTGEPERAISDSHAAVVRVYPRAYGGTLSEWCSVPWSALTGLSPRLRGNLGMTAIVAMSP